RYLPIGDDGLRHLRAIPELEAIQIGGGHRISPAGFETLARFRTLRYLVPPGPVGDVELRELTRLKELRSLTLYGGQLSDEGLATLAEFQQLRSLELSLPPTFAADGRIDPGRASVHLPEQLGRLKELRELSAHGLRVSPGTLKAIAQLPHLRSLDL